MIELEIDADGYALDQALRDHVRDKMSGLDQYMNSLSDGHVTVTWEGGTGHETLVRAQIWGGGHTFEASDTARDPVTAIDRTHHKLETQIRRRHGKEVDHHHHG